MTALEVLTETINAAHGAKTDPAKSRRQAQACLDALTRSGAAVVTEADIEELLDPKAGVSYVRKADIRKWFAALQLPGGERP